MMRFVMKVLYFWFVFIGTFYFPLLVFTGHCWRLCFDIEEVRRKNSAISAPLVRKKIVSEQHETEELLIACRVGFVSSVSEINFSDINKGNVPSVRVHAMKKYGARKIISDGMFVSLTCWEYAEEFSDCDSFVSKSTSMESAASIHFTIQEESCKKKFVQKQKQEDVSLRRHLYQTVLDELICRVMRRENKIYMKQIEQDMYQFAIQQSLQRQQQEQQHLGSRQSGRNRFQRFRRWLRKRCCSCVCSQTVE